MTLYSYLPYFIALPLIGFILSLFPSNKQEKAIYYIVVATILSHIAGAVLFTAFWVKEGMPILSAHSLDLYKNEQESLIFLDFYFDSMTVCYGIISSAITLIVARFSRYYMHREKGYKRFFNNLLAFYLGINTIIFAGNFETMFIGWEIIGITSFFLIAFYRDRYLPVKNALKVFSVYRLADIFFLLGIWISHHLFEKSITFAELQNLLTSNYHLIQEHSTLFILLPYFFLVVAAIKSAQFPFSSWLPRAMEGPTTSSAIFYGSLSVHIGVFLLIRTYPLWQGNALFTALVIAIGVITALLANHITHVQSSVKVQIAYASIAQIGLMFVEVGLGWHTLALFHFAGNAFVRTYQLLVSPSVLSYLIHEQFFSFIPPQHPDKNSLLGKIRLNLYTLGIKEWNLDRWLYKYLWQPPKIVGKWMTYFNKTPLLVVLSVLTLVGGYAWIKEDLLSAQLLRFLPEFFAFLAVLLALSAFSERKSGFIALLLIFFNQLFTALSISFNEHFAMDQIWLYLSGICISTLVAAACLQRLQNENEPIDLNSFQGHSYERPRLTIAFMLACLGISGFPITPTFIGEDLILGHIHENQMPLTILTALSLMFTGMAAIRLYARLFLGPHIKGYHEVAYRSS